MAQKKRRQAQPSRTLAKPSRRRKPLDKTPDALPRRELVSEKLYGQVTVRVQRVRCGKVACGCHPLTAQQLGKPVRLHGPYVYGFWRDGRLGRMRSVYGGQWRTERLLAHVKVLEGQPVTLEELAELAAVTVATKDEAAATQAPPGPDVFRWLRAELKRGGLSRGCDGRVPAAAASAWLESVEAMGFRAGTGGR